MSNQLMYFCPTKRLCENGQPELDPKATGRMASYIRPFSIVLIIKENPNTTEVKFPDQSKTDIVCNEFLFNLQEGEVKCRQYLRRCALAAKSLER